jgi:hypothetical protein
MKYQSEKANAIELPGGNIGRNAAISEEAHATGHYVVTCKDAEGKLKWIDTIENLVTTVGKDDALDQYLAGVGYTAAWYLGLISLTSYAAGVNVADTALSHAGWIEDVNYSNGARPTAAWSSAAAGSKALSSAAAFSINGTTTIKGCFLIANATKSGTSGILYSAGLFTGGDKAVGSGDTLNVSYTASL